MEKEPISVAKALQIEALPLLSEVLPYKFENGNVLEHLTITCSGCKNELSPDLARVNMEKWNESVSIKAYGMCRECRLITPVEAKLCADGSMLQKRNGNWSQGFWLTKKENELSWQGFIRGGWRDMLPPIIAGIIVGCWILTHK